MPHPKKRVMAGLDPAIHDAAGPMVARIKSGHGAKCLRVALLSILLLATGGSVASAEDDEFCRGLAVAVADGGNKFRSLRGQRFDNTLESFEANLRLPRLDTCHVDAITPGYFCMTRGLDREAGDELAGELVQRVHACYPNARATQQQDPFSPVARTVTEWTLDQGRTIRLVQRVYSGNPGSVYLYVR